MAVCAVVDGTEEERDGTGDGEDGDGDSEDGNGDAEEEGDGDGKEDGDGDGDGEEDGDEDGDADGEEDGDADARGEEDADAREEDAAGDTDEVDDTGEAGGSGAAVSGAIVTKSEGTTAFDPGVCEVNAGVGEDRRVTAEEPPASARAEPADPVGPGVGEPAAAGGLPWLKL